MDLQQIQDKRIRKELYNDENNEYFEDVAYQIPPVPVSDEIPPQLSKTLEQIVGQLEILSQVIIFSIEFLQYRL